MTLSGNRAGVGRLLEQLVPGVIVLPVFVITGLGLVVLEVLCSHYFVPRLEGLRSPPATQV